MFFFVYMLSELVTVRGEASADQMQLSIKGLDGERLTCHVEASDTIGRI